MSHKRRCSRIYNFFPEIGAALYISPKNAGVHVSNILRKLSVSGRVQVTALAERVGLLPSAQP